MQQITLPELQEKLNSGERLMLIDVREEHEHAAYNIGGILIPFGEIISKSSIIPKDQMVVLYCQKGVRSQIAIQRLEEKFGLANLFNLKGGIEKIIPHNCS